MSIINVFDGDTISYNHTGEGAFTVRVIGAPAVPVAEPQIVTYSQRDPLWRDLPYAASETFGSAGCYTVCVTMIYSLTGSLDEPPVVAEAMKRAGCYNGDYLAYPWKIPEACPGLRYDGPMDVTVDGLLRWHDCRADMERVYDELAEGPVIMEVDFVPGGEFNQHYVIAETFNEETGDLQIIDPWDGTRKQLLAAYSPAFGGWSLSRAIYGLRLLRLDR